MNELLARHGHHPNRYKKYHCLNPSHPDSHPSAGIFVARDGDERLHCFPCGFDEDVLGVAEVLGEPVDLQGVPRRRRVIAVPKVDHRVRELGRSLAGRAAWPLEWETAKLLASLDRLQAQQEVVRNWDYLSAHTDIPLVVATADILREVAHIRRPDRGDAVRALLDEVRQR